MEKVKHNLRKKEKKLKRSSVLRVRKRNPRVGKVGKKNVFIQQGRCHKYCSEHNKAVRKEGGGPVILWWKRMTFWVAPFFRSLIFG